MGDLFRGGNLYQTYEIILTRTYFTKCEMKFVKKKLPQETKYIVKIKK